MFEDLKQRRTIFLAIDNISEIEKLKAKVTQSRNSSNDNILKIIIFGGTKKRAEGSEPGTLRHRILMVFHLSAWCDTNLGHSVLYCDLLPLIHCLITKQRLMDEYL